MCGSYRPFRKKSEFHPISFTLRTSPSAWFNAVRHSLRLVVIYCYLFHFDSFFCFPPFRFRYSLTANYDYRNVHWRQRRRRRQRQQIPMEMGNSCETRVHMNAIRIIIINALKRVEGKIEKGIRCLKCETCATQNRSEHQQKEKKII